ncbi:hypothetical protein PAECIP112173_00397 [Paenibacillus sp. JJ-100]|uniref:hypothetical protein n=1 Tax=Paenibacillus sp. JJ-100 TaxID=2974896 RepID=UPI0022FF5176|nr:hypothetical protein [Paenibacillus sp. JJ-100]CAI6024749.1 hypothetical protein PAECIP112173_00397 [Paenibacillus sp. JJ-100]
MRTPMEIKRILAAARVPYPHILMDELEEAQVEIERLKSEKVELWECPGCGFTYAAEHEDIDPATGEGNGNHTCPVCEDVDLVRENERLRKELEEERKQAEVVRKAMQDVLYYLQRDSYIPAQDILEQYLAMSVGQEGEGNQ